MKLVLFALACLVALTSAQTGNAISACTDQGVIIDDFRVRSGEFDRLEVLVQGTGLQTLPSHPVTGAASSWIYRASTYPMGPGAPANILGGYRDVIVYVQLDSSPNPAPGQGARININTGTLANGTAVPQLQYSVDSGVRAVGEIQWDGNADATTPQNFVKTGLGGVDLASVADSFTIALQSTDLPARFRVEAWSFAGGVSANSQGVFFEWDPRTVSEQIFSFNQFQPISGSVDPMSVFSSLGAMRLFITQGPESGAPEIDLTIYSLGFVRRFCLYKSVAPNPSAISTVEGLFPLFFGSTQQILNGDCAHALRIGDRVVYFVQAFSEGAQARSFHILDTLASGMSLVPGSIRTFTHGIAGLVATSVPASCANCIDVRVDVPANLGTGARVTVFYDAIIGVGAVDQTTCQSTVPNRASLVINGTSPLLSVHFNGTDIEARATLICVSGVVNCTMTHTIDKTEVAIDETFTITPSFRNTGSVGAANTFLTVEYLNCSASLLTTGFTRVSDTKWQMALGTLPASNSSTSMALRFSPLASAECEFITIRFCVTNMQNTQSPEFCRLECCQTVTVHVNRFANIKLCKRVRLFRRLHYEIDFYNCGSGRADQVQVTEIIPIGAVLNPQLSDSRWACNATHCTILVPSMEAGTAQCAIFVLDILNETEICEIFNNTARVDVLSPDTVESSLLDNEANFTIQQLGCPIPELPPCAECCECPKPPAPPAMCPCPGSPCDACWEKDDGRHDSCDDECGAHGKTTINLDFSGESAQVY